MTPDRYPDNPVLASAWRGDRIESVHRGSWCLVDSSGHVLEQAGTIEHPFFTRSAVKALQVLPLFESGAAARYALTDEEVALAVSSHNAEPCHVETALGLLARIGLGPESLGCGPQPPGDSDARFALKSSGGRPARIHNNCSGKHAGFLALTRHLGADPARYLDFESESQVLVRAAVAEMCGVAPESLGRATDGCSAPTFRMSLRAVATAFARYTTPDGLAPERRAAAERVVAAVQKHPVLLAGRSKRICTALVEASGGKLFPKIGAEAVYVIGVPGRDLGLAVKMDDGGMRGLHAVVIGLLRRLDLLEASVADALESYAQTTLRNWDGLVIGRITLP
ncbi:L-asparaginase II [Planctomycetes bacterium Poly30]|uniref:L-asparaginase II n=1 Tax=Saltatorellus ferox TaxID=2528018 RepID=A0A518EXB0_9BACT|nr:L-asparaginase II [Planctomycetes bacterium Poly30]